jgi:hypothetical protein
MDATLPTGQFLGPDPFHHGVSTSMAKHSDEAARETGSTAASAERYQAAYRAAEGEIADLRPGEAIQYHEGNLAIDLAADPAIAGRAAAFRDAAATGEGLIAQRRLGVERYQYVFWRGRREQR